jgi:RepB DNA-primase from phage plasmid
MPAGGADHGTREARAMLETFASVGATEFDVTLRNEAKDWKILRRDVKLADLWQALPLVLAGAVPERRNVIVRPHGPGVSFVQLDDLKPDMLARLAPAVFLILKTSPGNFQARVAIEGADKDLARRLRKGTEPTPRRAVPPASPAASISRKSTRRIFRAWRSSGRSRD